MVVRAVKGIEPDIHEDAYVDPEAVVIGDVTLEKDANVWPNTTLRGDAGNVRVGEGTNVQDGAVVHEETDIGPYVTVGHNAIVHAARVERGALVGMGAIVLDGCHVGEGAIVGANAVVTEGTEIPPRTLAVGTPAEVVREFDEDSTWVDTAEHYVERSKRYAETSRVVEE